MVDLDRHATPLAYTPKSIEQVIEDIGSRYVADLRMLTEEISRFYLTQLAEKDEQLAQSQQRLATVEQERAMIAARLHDQEQFNTRYVAELRAWTEELNRRIATAEYGKSELEPATAGAAL